MPKRKESPKIISREPTQDIKVGGFSCKHCGTCCRDEMAPPNLSIHDVKRISAFLGVDIMMLSDFMGLVPFYDYETKTYTEEIGIKMPCKFHKNDKCSIYPARPLNCRMFPYQMLAGNAAIEPGRACHTTKVSEKNLVEYREYVTKLGEQILNEAKETEEFLAKTDKEKILIKLKEYT
jgi:Fe-S-cluster containining protein